MAETRAVKVYEPGETVLYPESFLYKVLTCGSKYAVIQCFSGGPIKIVRIEKLQAWRKAVEEGLFAKEGD